MSLNIEISKDGYRILKTNIDNKKQYFGSKYNQKREIEKFIKSVDEITPKDNYIIFGLSFGEHIEELLKLTYSNNKIFIIEFNQELKDFCERDLKVRKILDDSRVELFSEIKDIEEFFGNFINEANINQLKTMIYSNYYKLYQEKTMEICGVIRDQFMSVILSRNTGIIAGELSFDNLLNNLKYIAKSTIVNKLKGKYKNKPAIIVSAGPSLSKNIDNLKDVKNALILSGGRTLRPLLEKNVMPSCIGIVDPGEVSFKIVEEYIDKTDCPLIFNDQINPKILEQHKENNYFTRINVFLDDIWEEQTYILSRGGSIAHTLTILATFMECNPIVFIGQDFAYTGEQGHDVSAGNKWRELTFDEYKRNDDIYVEDVNGNAVRTSLVLNDYRKSMEEIIAAYPEFEFINATEGGANIKGAKNEKLAEVLKRFDSEEVIKLNEYVVNEDKTDVIIKKLQTSLEDFKTYIKLCEKGKKLLKDYTANYYLKNNKNMIRTENSLNKVDKEIKDNLEKLYLINFALSKMIYEVEGKEEYIVKKSDDEKTIFKKNSDRADAIYSGIKEVIEVCYEKIEKTIKELKENIDGK